MKRSKGRPPGQARRDDLTTRKLILEAALAVFSVDGFEGASIASIAGQAKSHGVSPPLVHYYFKTKNELWRAALEYGLGNVLSESHDMLADLDDVGHVPRLKFFVKRHIALMASRPEVFQIIIRESEQPGPRLTWLTETYLSRWYAMVVRIIEEGQSAGEISAIAPPYHVAQIIIGACYHYLGSRHRMKEAYGIDVLSEEVRTRHANAVLEILFGGLVVAPAATGAVHAQAAPSAHG